MERGVVAHICCVHASSSTHLVVVMVMVDWWWLTGGDGDGDAISRLYDTFIDYH